MSAADDDWTTFESPKPDAPTSAVPSAPMPPALVEPVAPPKTPTEWKILVWLAGGLAFVLWVWVVVQAQSNYSSIESLHGTDASAVQISQLADESIAQLLPYVAGASAATVAMLGFAALGILSRRT